LRGGRGAGPNDFSEPTTKRRFRGPLHHPSLANASYGWSPSPAFAGAEAYVPVPARAFACGPPDLSHVKRESGSKKSGEGWLASPCLFAFPVSPVSLRAAAKQSSLTFLGLWIASFLAMTNERIWNAGRRRAVTSAPFTVRRRPLNGRVRLAFRRSTTALPKGCVVPWCDPGQASWMLCQRGGYDRRLRTHFQRRTPHTGRNAGRHDARTAREQVASPPAGTASRPTAAACLRGGVLSSGEMIRSICNEKGDGCQGVVATVVTVISEAVMAGPRNRHGRTCSGHPRLWGGSVLRRGCPQ
jgi:hypothetical protein